MLNSRMNIKRFKQYYFCIAMLFIIDGAIANTNTCDEKTYACFSDKDLKKINILVPVDTFRIKNNCVLPPQFRPTTLPGMKTLKQLKLNGEKNHD